MVKWAKNLARTLLPLDGRWVLDETSENEEASGGPEPILVSEIEPEGEGPVENPFVGLVALGTRTHGKERMVKHIPVGIRTKSGVPFYRD